MNYFLGIDIGTTHTKAVIITEDGQPVFSEKQGYDLLRPQPGYEEQDVTVIMDAVTGLVRQALASVPENMRVTAVGFSAAMHSILPVDENGEPLYNAIIWADTRSRKEAEAISEHPDAATIYRNTGIPAHPMSPLCKIAWFKNQLPGIFARTAKFISIKEYVFSCLFGKYIVDHSIASATGLFNTRENKWDAHALQMAGIDESKLSQPVSTVHREYGLVPFYASLFALDRDTPFVAGASDGCLANLGSGAALHGETALTIGTSGAVRMTVELPGGSVHLPDSGRLFTYPLAGDLYVRGGAINNGGIVLEWLGELLLPGKAPGESKYETLLSLAAQAPPGANGLLFLPYLLGERAPVWDADAKGVLAGLTMKHRQEHVARAAMEGICFTLCQLIGKLEAAYGPVNGIYASGGFVRSPFWVQLIADVTGKKIKITETADASAMGAAFLAMHATGFLPSLAGVKQFIQVDKEYEPGPARHRVYAELFRLFGSLYPKLKDDFAALGRLQEN